MHIHTHTMQTSAFQQCGGTHGSDDWQIVSEAECDEVGLGDDVIDAVHHEGWPAAALVRQEQSLGVLDAEHLPHGLHLAPGHDALQVSLHGLHLRVAHVIHLGQRVAVQRG